MPAADVDDGVAVPWAVVRGPAATGRAGGALGGSRAGPRSGGEGAHKEVAADRGEQRQLKRRQRAVVTNLSAAHPSPHAHAAPYPAASARDAHGGPSLRRL